MFCFVIICVSVTNDTNSVLVSLTTPIFTFWGVGFNINLDDDYDVDLDLFIDTITAVVLWLIVDQLKLS